MISRSARDIEGCVGNSRIHDQLRDSVILLALRSPDRSDIVSIRRIEVNAATARDQSRAITLLIHTSITMTLLGIPVPGHSHCLTRYV